jgi:hypothetical protein
MELRNEPMSGGDSALRSEPEFRMDRGKLITQVEKCKKWRVRVRGAIVFLNDDGIAFKSDIAFVGGEEEGKEARFDHNRVTKGEFMRIVVFDLVMEDKFTKMQDGVKTGQKLGKKKEFIMGWGR